MCWALARDVCICYFCDMNKSMLILPTFDGQKKSVSIVDPQAIDMIRPSVMAGMCNVYVNGDQSVNYIPVLMEIHDLIKKMEGAGCSFLNLAGDTLESLKITKENTSDSP